MEDLQPWRDGVLGFCALGFLARVGLGSLLCLAFSGIALFDLRDFLGLIDRFLGHIDRLLRLVAGLGHQGLVDRRNGFVFWQRLLLVVGDGRGTALRLLGFLQGDGGYVVVDRWCGRTEHANLAQCEAAEQNDREGGGEGCEGPAVLHC